MSLSIDRLCDIVGYRLSDEQLEAVTADLTKPLRVVAGAGSGKTSVMAARVVWAVGNGFIDPEQALGLTFTTKAAAELGSRIRKLLDRLDDFPGEALVSTYHSFAHQLVTEHGLRLGVEPGARMLADNENYHLAYRVLRDTRLPLSGFGKGPAGLVGDVIALDQQLSEHVVTPQQVRDSDRRLIEQVDGLDKTVSDDRKARDIASRRIQLMDVVDELRAAKLAGDVVDFADLLRFGSQLALEHPDVSTICRERWQLVMLDEYQDTSIVQARMLSGLFGGGHSVTAVGDPLQGIYGWRGASVQAMDEFPDLFPDKQGNPARTCELSISQRSGPAILDVANRLAEPLRDANPSVVTLKPRIDEAGLTPPDGIRAALFTTYAQESQWIADRIAEQLAAGVEPDRIAVLCRAGKDFAATVDALHAQGIPAEVSALEGLLAQPEVIDVISTLEVLYDPTANPAALRLLLGPRWRIGARDLAILGRRASYLARVAQPRSAKQDADGDTSVDSALAKAIAGSDPVDVVSLIEAVEDPGSAASFAYSEDARQRFSDLTAELNSLRSAVGHPLVDLVEAVIERTGLDVEVALAAWRSGGAVPNHNRGMAALAGIRNLVATFSDLDGDTGLGSFLAWVQSVEQFGGEPGLEMVPASGAVQVMTIHKAKGLEWDVVLVADVVQGSFPSTKSRSTAISSQAQIPSEVRGDRAALPTMVGFGTKAHTAFQAAMKSHVLDEETRLAYVAATRPRRLLLASGHWWGPTQTKTRGPSEFLYAIRDSCLQPSDEDPWHPEPEADAKNPLLEAVEQYEWPAMGDADLHGKRGKAAELVRAAMTADEAVPDLPVGALTPSEQTTVDQWDADLQVLLDERNRPAQQRHVQLPETLSASSLMAITKDRDGFTRNLVRPMPQAPNARARRGTRFHDWVEHRFGQRTLFEEIPGAAEGDGLADTDLAQLQEAFLRSEFADREPWGIEVPFSIVLGGRVIKGRIDAVYRSGEDWEVVDWKTNERTTSDPLQLAVYRVALAATYGIDLANIRAAFFYVSRNEVSWHEGLQTAEELVALVTGEQPTNGG